MLHILIFLLAFLIAAPEVEPETTHSPFQTEERITYG